MSKIKYWEVATSTRRLRPVRQVGAVFAFVALVWAVDQYRELVRAASGGGGAAGVVEACETAVNERWPGGDPLRFDESGALRNAEAGAWRFVSQFRTFRGELVHFACEARPGDDGGWTVARLSIVSR